MNNQIKIIQQNGTFFGYLLQNGHKVFQTAPCPSANAASKQVSDHIATLQAAKEKPVTIQQVKEPTLPARNTVRASPPSPVKRVSGGCGCRRG